MLDIPKKRDARRGGPERRVNPRYRLSPAPEVEILTGDDGAPVRASFGDLSRSGCYVETDCLLPLETEVTVTLRNGGDHVRARARVVRAIPEKGVGLAFTSMELEAFRILESWLSIYVATTWAAANRRRAQRVDMKVAVRVSGYDGEGARFAEDTQTIVISALGGLVTLRTAVKLGQRLVLSNPQTKRTAECMVAYREPKGAEWQVGLAFIVLNQPFWPVEFPAADWSARQPDADPFDS